MRGSAFNMTQRRQPGRSQNNSALRGYVHQSTDFGNLGKQASQPKFLSPNYQTSGGKSSFQFGKNAELAMMGDPGSNNLKSEQMFPTLDQSSNFERKSIHRSSLTNLLRKAENENELEDPK